MLETVARRMDETLCHCRHELTMNPKQITLWTEKQKRIVKRSHRTDIAFAGAGHNVDFASLGRRANRIERCARYLNSIFEERFYYALSIRHCEA